MARPLNVKAREKILGGAFELFHERGFKGVSMDEVAAKAGIKKANLFHYYPTKEDLGLAVIERAVACMREKIAAQLSNGGEPIRAVERLFSDSAAGMEGRDCVKGCFIGNLAQELGADHERMRRKISEHLDFWVGRLADFLERHRAKGYFRGEMKPRQAAQAILSLLEGATLFCKAHRSAEAMKHGQAMAAAYLRGLKA